MTDKRKVILVDDDLYFLQSTKGRLRDRGFEVITATTLSTAKTQITNNSDAAAVVIDIMMPSDGESDLETQMGYKSGLVLARWVTQQVNLVFVLLTPDDVGGSASTNDAKRRARQNVIFEMGFFFGKLHRKSGRIILLYKGILELPSDISGIIYIDISNGIESAGEEIQKELAFITG